MPSARTGCRERSSSSSTPSRGRSRSSSYSRISKTAKGRTLADLLDEFALVRRQTLDELAALGLTDVELARRGVHPALGSVTLRQLLASWVVHDSDDLVQISRVLALGILG